MKNCCENKSHELTALREKQRGVLKAVLIINAVMFLIEFAGGLLTKSSAVLADSLDMLGDASVYGFSLYVLNKTEAWKAKAGLLKGIMMAAFGLVVLSDVAKNLFSQTVPAGHEMGLIGVVALVANTVCLYILFSHRQDDINMRSTWICSRNDIIANLSVIVASFLVVKFNSFWPDVIVSLGIVLLFLGSSFHIIKESITQIKSTSHNPA